jgi:hypothetical protein
MAGM